jgi:hypothetical protein
MLQTSRTVWSREKEWRKRNETRFRDFGILSCLYKWATSTASRIMHHHVQLISPPEFILASMLVDVANRRYMFYYNEINI